MGQVALKSLSARPETTVQRMVDIFNGIKSLSFLDLPGECRNEVYKFVFDHPKIVVTRTVANPSWASRYFEKISEHYITHVRFNRNLLLTCKTIRTEATPLLSAACTLAVYRHYERTSPITRVPTIHLLGIRRLEIEVHTFIWVPRKLLPNLKEVTLIHSDLNVDGMLLHTLGCSRCGSEAELLKEMVIDIEDWEWKRKQFMHTATEEGFKIELAVKVIDYEASHLVYLSLNTRTN
jgi:hypothetical protein